MPMHEHVDHRCRLFVQQERLFEQLLQVISQAAIEKGKQQKASIRQLICKVQEIHTTLLKHLSKEEEQLFPLLLQNFTYAEQVALNLSLSACRDDYRCPAVCTVHFSSAAEETKIDALEINAAIEP